MQDTRTRPGAVASNEANVEVEAIDYLNVKTILLADGPHRVQGGKLIQFAIGEGHSPVSPAKLYPTLRFEENGTTWRVPLSQILAFSDQ